MPKEYDIQFKVDLPEMKKIFLQLPPEMPDRIVEVTQPAGAGGSYYVFLNRYYQGQIVMEGSSLQPMLNANTELTEEEINRELDKLRPAPGQKG